jgi:hypothetical protein
MEGMSRTPNRRRPYVVFISCSHSDRWIARQWVNLIERIGKGRVRTFLDEKDIESGDSIPEEIRKKIRKCDELVVLLTPSSKDRPWVTLEMTGAWFLGKRVNAVLYSVSPKEMPEFMYPYKALDLAEFDRYIEQLKVRLRGKAI